ncbi:uncharacterized protein LOC116001167 [Ipomoea triloba]|uniref:uncharacterized protein LOC116001167 n=1 Tax=Ipomoea triloba TaxID=35885 RepID=UPI00125D06C3|nr:uncharacterized protein LOC116001167 [Ipomoea triloba]
MAENQVVAEEQRTLRELSAPNLNQQPLCIQHPALEVGFELRSGLIQLLPTFRGLENEDPHKHLKEFHVVYSSFKPQRVTKDQIKLRVFPFSLADRAKDWLFYLPSGSINTWDEMVRLFLEKFFPASQAASIRREICGIKQRDTKTLHEYWERFKQMCASCPQHGVSEQLLIQYFYEGLLPMERKMMDAASGGAIVNKTPREARDLISIMTANSQQFGCRQDTPSRRVNEVNISSLENKVSHLTTLVQQLALGGTQQVKACGICAATGHQTDMCPTLQYDYCEQANAVGGFPGQPQRNYDPYSNTYNPGWRDHPNFSYKPRPQFPHFQPRQPIQQQPSSSQQPSSNSSMSLEDIVKSLATNTQQFQQETRTRIQHLESQMSLLVSTVSRLKSQENEKEVYPPQNDQKLAKESPETLVIPPPFPSRLANSKKAEEQKEILETFRKVEVNIPLLDAIKQIPQYAKFLKELCTNKRKLKGNEMVNMGENVSTILQKILPPKCKDPSMFTIPCKIGNVNVERAMLDLGASINVMPLSIYSSLNVGSLKETGVIVQLADRSNVYPIGVLEDVLVQVDGLIFPADFYVLDMEEDNSPNSSLILLGRPFLKTSKTKIDVHDDTLTMEFNGALIKFNIYNAMKYPDDVSSVSLIDAVDPLVQKISYLTDSDALEVALNMNFTPDGLKKIMNEFSLNFELQDIVNELESLKHMKYNVHYIELPTSSTKLLPSVIQAPKIELKPLPDHLKYAFLGDGEILPVLISNKLSTLEEEKLVRVLREYKEAIGWTIADIKGLSPSTCMHQILLEDDYKLSKQAQRRLNPSMMEVVKKEILKLLDAGIIYPISYSKWVSPVHVIPKKTGITVVENDDGELVPTRIQNGWRIWFFRFSSDSSCT